MSRHTPFLALVAVLAVLVLTAPTAPGGSAPEGTLLVANRDGGSISFVDLALGIEIARLPIGPRIPHEVAVSPDGRWALTGEYGPGDDPGRRLVVLDVPNAAIAGYIELPVPSRPHSMVFLPGGRRAVATMQDADAIAVVDVLEREVLDVRPTGGREGHMVRIGPDGSRAYVTNRGAEGTLSVISLDRDSEPVVIATGEGAEGIAVTPDGREVWVANRRDATISIVDTDRLEVVETLESRPFPNRVEISSGGRAAVTNAMSGEEVGSFLRVYEVATRAVVGEVSLDEDGRLPSSSYGLLAHGSTAFVGDRAGRRILTFDLESPGPPTVLASAHEQPDGMAWSPLRVAALEGRD